ncbi:hypothetical protein B0E45_29245 [Sinorhizobium sp. A49]|uniref:hypothetical protein n=1 Tax=Sinorhizobium sp. A49 TaxID=1945861 RepID=UPI000985AE65|nr:hypothetical protein [Sinorhizobium sp. A49]OOG63596.1 hypothetical protein B0E45_29245 [Sinorhizobium sp. A49]
MNVRLLAASMAIGLLCMIALYLFAPRTPPSDAEFKRSAETFLKRSGAMEEWVGICRPLLMPQLSDAKHEGALLSTLTTEAEDVCLRFLKVIADGRLTMSEVNSQADPFPFKVVEDAERRPPAVNGLPTVNGPQPVNGK